MLSPDPPTMLATTGGRFLKRKGVNIYMVERQQIKLALGTGEPTRRVRLVGYADRSSEERAREDAAYPAAARDLADRRGDRGRGLDPDRGDDGYYGA
ncbi:MAG TPA: hypothetical protein VLB73_00585 [Patescibacteria group bacterium]|nr:hypothetical protein [Patescibacteria group bacterium]